MAMFLKMVALAVFAAACLGQEPVLRSKAELVLVPVSITDRSGHYMRDLSEKDLVLYDDNVPQRIQFEDVTLPVSLVIAVQTTPASQIVVDKLRKSTGVIGPMITGFKGEAAVVAFGRAIKVVQPFTSNEDDVARTIHHLEASSVGAGILDAVIASLRLLGERPADRRRVLLVLSEKHDLSSSKEQIGTAAMLAQRENLTVYSVTFSPSRTQWTAKVPVYCDPPSGTCGRCT
jgi:VWFA-related protein